MFLDDLLGILAYVVICHSVRVQPPDPAAMRRRYDGVGLSEADAPPDPLTLFAAWFTDAAGSGLTEPNAMVVATVDEEGWPQARTVLLKGFDARGLRFFTNASSAKGRQLAQNPRAAVVLPWHPIGRQVRAVGAVEVVDAAEVAAYFASRPRESQLGAWASPQSQVVTSRAELDRLLAQAAQRFPEGRQVPVPPGWDGFRVVPRMWEFWAGRPGRMHDRLRYRRDRTGWVLERLAP